MTFPTSETPTVGPLAAVLMYAGEPDRVPEGAGWRALEPEPVDPLALSSLAQNELWRIDDVHALLGSLTHEVLIEEVRAAGAPGERLRAFARLIDPVLPEAPRGCVGCMCGSGGCGGGGQASADTSSPSVSDDAPSDGARLARQTSQTLRAVRLLWSGEVIPVEALAAMAGQGDGWWNRLGYLVRHFAVQGGGIVVDTVGLEGFGLPDVQLHTDSVPSTEAVGAVDEIAKQLLAQGDPGDGARLEAAGRAWTASQAGALAPPAREVLDLTE